MFTPAERVLQFALMLLVGAFFLMHGYKLFAGIMILSSLFQVYGYFRYGTVWRAFRYFRKEDLFRAKKLLASIHFPRLLSRGQRGFYYMMSAAVLMYYDKEVSSVEALLRQALTDGVRTSTNECIIYIMYAQLHILQHNFNDALKSLQKATETPHPAVMDENMNKMRDEIYVLMEHQPL